MSGRCPGRIGPGRPGGRARKRVGETRISIYNKAKYCWAHAPVRYYIPRGRKRRPEPEAA